MTIYSFRIRLTAMISCLLVICAPWCQILIQTSFAQSSPPQLTLTDIEDAHREIFERLFDRPWSETEWTYPLREPVTGRGRYIGRNHFDQPFTLNVVAHTPVDLAGTPISDEDHAWAIAEGMSFAAV